jgi:hypothetical protein
MSAALQANLAHDLDQNLARQREEAVAVTHTLKVEHDEIHHGLSQARGFVLHRQAEKVASILQGAGKVGSTYTHVL